MGTDAISKAQIESRQRHMEFDGLFSAAEAFRNAYRRFAKRGLGGNVGAVEAIPALVERGKASVLRFYNRLNEDLGRSRYVAGDSFSIADIIALCAVDFASMAARVPVPDSCENLTRWHADVSARLSARA